MKILVTGGAGFIGSNIADALIEKSHDVVVMDNLSTGNKSNVNPRAKFYETDIRDKNSLDKIFDDEKPEAVFHLAAQASVNVSIKKPAFDVENNIIGTINLLEAARDHGSKKFVFSSTGGAIYGDSAKRPTPETAEGRPASPYGIDKLANEHFISFFCKNSDLKATVLRYANVYGPRQNPHGEAGVIAIFTSQMLQNKPLTLCGNGEHTRDYVYVSDVVDANLIALENDSSGPFNIGTGIETSVSSLIKLLFKAAGKHGQIDRLPERIEQRNSSLDSSLAQKILGWKSVVKIEDGIKKTVEFYSHD